MPLAAIDDIDFKSNVLFLPAPISRVFPHVALHGVSLVPEMVSMGNLHVPEQVLPSPF